MKVFVNTEDILRVAREIEAVPPNVHPGRGFILVGEPVEEAMSPVQVNKFQKEVEDLEKNNATLKRDNVEMLKKIKNLEGQIEAYQDVTEKLIDKLD